MPLALGLSHSASLDCVCMSATEKCWKSNAHPKILQPWHANRNIAIMSVEALPSPDTSTHRKAQTVYVILKEQIHRNQSIHSSVYQTIYPLVYLSIHLCCTARQGSWLKYRQKSRDCLCKTFRKNTHESINRSYGIDRPIHQN